MSVESTFRLSLYIKKLQATTFQKNGNEKKEVYGFIHKINGCINTVELMITAVHVTA